MHSVRVADCWQSDCEGETYHSERSVTCTCILDAHLETSRLECVRVCVRKKLIENLGVLFVCISLCRWTGVLLFHYPSWTVFLHGVGI